MAGWTDRFGVGVSALGTGGLAQKAVLPVLGVGEARGRARARRGLDLSPEAPGRSPVLARHPLALSAHATQPEPLTDWPLPPGQAPLTTPCRLGPHLRQSSAPCSLQVPPTQDSKQQRALNNVSFYFTTETQGIAAPTQSSA